MLSNSKFRRRIISGAIGIIVVVLFIVAIAPMMGSKVKKVNTQSGIAYLKQMASKDVSDIEAQIQEIKKQELKAALMEDSSSVWSYFDDAVIMGDSRTMGFYMFGFLPQDQVMAHNGATIRDIPTYLDALELKNPSLVFLCYGLNDMGIGFWNTPQEYTTELQERVDQIQERLPNAEIYVCAIVPVTSWANYTEEYKNKPYKYNPEIKAYCEANGINYIDISNLSKDYEDLVEVDGTHFKTGFYDPWAVMMISEVAAQ